jgi:anaerobic ribonucleoside-triphosphate reductase activating protein
MKTDKNIEELLKNVDVVVDGKFVDKLKSTKHIYRGSSNQRLIDVKKTLKNKKIFEYILLKKGGKKDV